MGQYSVGVIDVGRSTYAPKRTRPCNVLFTRIIKMRKLEFVFGTNDRVRRWTDGEWGWGSS
jgi:hypothetical protein